MTFVAAVCPQCSGALQVPDDRDVVKCMYCGVDVVVRQAIRLVQGNTGNLLELGEAARAGGNNSEAISYFNKVLENDPKNVQAWIGKASAAGWSSTMADFRFSEMYVAFENAVKYCDKEHLLETREKAALTINEVALACYSMSRKHMLEYVALDNTWAEYLPRCSQVVSALEVAHAYLPDNSQIIDNIVHICKDNIEGVAYNDPYDNNLRKTVHLSDGYEAELRALMARHAETLTRLDPSYVAPEAKRPSTSCFVVTATFGDSNHKTVRFLRSFRDEHLQGSKLGRRFIGWYYTHGPAMAKHIEGSGVFRKLTFLLVVLPAVGCAKLLIRVNRARASAGQNSAKSDA